MNLGALHRNEPEFVVKAPLAKRLGFFYTFLKGKLPDNGVGVCGRPFRREMEQEKGDHHVYDHELLGAAAAKAG